MRRARRRGPGALTVGVVALALLCAGVYLGFTKAIPFRSHYEVSAVFKSANNIRPGSPVRVAGIEVGTVREVDFAERGSRRAEVRMRIRRSGLPLHEDATFAIRPRIFLEGNFFVDVTPGTPASPTVDADHVFPVNQTRTPVQLDQILAALRSDTREDLKTLLAEYSSALEGRGARGFNRSIRSWKPAYRDSAIVSDALLGAQEGDLSGYVRGAGATAAGLDRDGERLKSLITDFRVTAGAFARVDGSLRATLRELPRTLRTARPALGELNRSFPSLRALARDLRPGVRSSGPAIDAARPLARQLRAAVAEPELRGLSRDLRGATPGLAALADRSRPLLSEARLNASCANEVLLPWTLDEVGDPKFPASGPVFQEFAKVLPGLAGESRSGDANGQWFRVLLSGGTNLVQLSPGRFATTALPINGANPPKPPGRPPNRPDVPCETQVRPDLRSNPSAPPPQRRVDTGSERFRERDALARRRAVRWLERRLEVEGLDRKLSIGDGEATEALLDRVAADAGAPQVRQLEAVRKALGR